MAAAVQMLHGKALYRDIWFDKPPLVPAFYLLFGAHTGVPLRLAGAAFVLLCCWLAYRFARDRWGEREGVYAAALLAFFLTFGIPAAVMAAAADLLSVAPHLAAVWLAARGRPVAAGAAAGVAFQCNTKAAFVLAVCALWEWRRAGRLLAGFALPNAAVFGWLALQGSLRDYYDQVWRLGFIYARDTFVASPLREGLIRTLNWMGFHAALMLGAAVFWARERDRRFAAWAVLAAAAAFAGWRFFPRYYFHLLPVAALAAARGLALAGPVRAAALVLMIVPLVRFGPRYATLALYGERGWSDTAMDRDSRAAARLILARARPGDTLFVWGYRPDLYVYTRLPAASRFLESQPLSGIFADRQLFAPRPSYPEWAARNRRELVRSRPAFIADGLAVYNAGLGIDEYPDLRPWLANYRLVARSPATLLYAAAPE